jgi:ribosomal protein S19
LDSAPLKNKNIKITPLGGVLEPRNVTITPDNVGKTYVVNIGKDKPSSKTSNNIGRVTVTTKHIGHKFGEYAISKIPAVYKRNSKNK